MKKAYYIIGVEKFAARLCLGEYSPKEDPFDMMKAVQNSFASIQKTGYITRDHEFYDITDTLIGRQEYITLSLGKCGHWKESSLFGSVKEGIFGFIFDAYDLIQHGAFLTIQHIYEDYKRMTRDVITRVASTLPDISQEDLEDGMFPELMLALERGDRDDPGYQQVMEGVQQEIHAIHGQKQLQAQAALAYLNHAPEDGSCQIWVRKQLPIAQAIGTIEEGEEIFSSRMGKQVTEEDVTKT